MLNTIPQTTSKVWQTLFVSCFAALEDIDDEG